MVQLSTYAIIFWTGWTIIWSVCLYHLGKRTGERDIYEMLFVPQPPPAFMPMDETK